MKSVLIAIQPKYCELIANGKKTVEVRKTKPKLDVPFKCYIYCTNKKPSDNEWQYKPNLYLDKTTKPYKVHWIDVEFTRTYNCEYLQQRVIGEFVCDEIHEFTKAFFDEQEPQDTDEIEFWLNQFNLSYNELRSYVGTNDFYGWHITDLVIYDKQKELGEFKKIYRECWYADLGLAKRDCSECKNADCFVKRPPQSWCYVEDLGV